MGERGGGGRPPKEEVNKPKEVVSETPETRADVSVVPEMSEEVRRRVEQLREAHARWKALPEGKRGKFNSRKLKRLKSSLYVWMCQHGGVDRFVMIAGGDIEKDFKKMERVTGRTPESAVVELRAVHTEWKASPEVERGKFNPSLVEKSAAGLYGWMRQRGGIDKFVALAGGDVKRDFEKEEKTTDRTPESAVAELRAMHKLWKALPETERGKFNPQWITGENKGLHRWMDTHGGVDKFITIAGGDIEKDFEKEEQVRDRTPESAVAELRAAHVRWKALPEDERGKFDLTYLGWAIYGWARRHGGIEKFVALAGGDAEKDFERVEKVTDRTPESAVAELRAAHKLWKALPETERGKFNPRWLARHSLADLVLWMGRRGRGGIEKFVALAGGDVEKDFEKRIMVTDRTPESAVAELRAVHTEWKALPETKRRKLNPNWFRRQIGNTYAWMENNGGIEKFVALAGGDIEKDFEKEEQVRDRTPESAVAELRATHKLWKALPETERGKFNPEWISKRYGNFYSWLIRHGGIDKFVALAGGDAEKDFERVEKVTDRTPESAVAELRATHKLWKALQETERGKFNPEWIRERHKALSSWLQKHGGIDKFVALAGGDVEKDFEKRGSEDYESRRLGELNKELEVFVKEIVKGQTPTAQEFQSLVRAVGASRCLDVLYQFHPKFRDLPIEDVNGMIADYLGDFLVEKGKFKGNDIPPAIRRLPSNISYQDGLYETLKDAGLPFYFEHLRAGKKMSGAEIVYAYLEHLLGSFDREGLKSKEFDDVIQRVVDYYESVSKDFSRPEKFVDALDETREFPDMGQRVNMKEIAEKGRVLIADEMGLGKSASVIMAKEHLGARCAVIVAPSNVISTWERYLSDDHEQGGYYKSGMAPRVLMIDEPRDLKKLSGTAYDFILISQEKMTDSYAHALQGIDFDMMVVDEVHKLKSLEGVRSPNLLRLAEKVKGDGKYLALLSGTPVPNKVEDIAIILKLLYPDEFSEMENKELVRSIINGEMMRLRSLLVPRMQLKELRQAVDMPELKEEEIFIEMSASEKDVYEVLLEEDELGAGQKMAILRKFLLNPESVDATPGIESSKIRRVSEELAEVFKRHDKVVMYVNDYMEDVVRGDLSIIADLAPAGVEVRVIHGEVVDDMRETIRQEFIMTNKKTLLVVSGQTADVGVDFSCADHIMFYNEPWRETDKRQQLSRVYRPGLAHPLKSDAFIVKDTIEDGMHAYIWRKYVAVQKLLGGIPISNLEKRLLEKDEKSKEPNIAVNPELARYYFSSWDKMMRIFGYVKGIGEERFKEFLGEFATDYAEAYADLGNRSYQSNANRAAGTIISKMASEMGVKPESARILDLASGPEMLKQHIGEEYQDRVFSVDLNKEHFSRKNGDHKVIGSVLTLPFADESFNFVNYCLSFHYLDFVPSRERLGRLQALVEMNRVLKVGGRAVINLVYSLELRNFEQFKKVVGELGFRVVDSYSGEAKAGNNYNSYFIALEKTAAIDQTVSIGDRSDKIGRENLNGLKFNPKEGRLKDSRRVITEFQLGGKTFPIKLNKSDREIYAEEQKVLHEGEELKRKYGKIESIPREKIVENNFVRILIGEKYKLFKRLVAGPGIVLIS